MKKTQSGAIDRLGYGYYDEDDEGVLVKKSGLTYPLRSAILRVIGAYRDALAHEQKEIDKHLEDDPAFQMIIDMLTLSEQAQALRAKYRALIVTLF